MRTPTTTLHADAASHLEERIALIEKELSAIRDRNRRVETNKAWETSRVRLLSITAITYVTMLLVFVMLGSSHPLFDAMVPTTGFFLSTLSLSSLRARWETRSSRTQPDNSPNRHVKDPIVAGLCELLDTHSDKRVVVLGTTCTGKSTMLSAIPGARDQDREVFPRLTKEQSDYVCQEPWTEEIGRAMTAFVREHVKSARGRPVFGTVVIDCDLIVLLKISDDLLRARTERRNVTFSDAKDMQTQLEREVAGCGTPFVEYSVG